MAHSKTVKIDLSEIDELIYKLQSSSSSVMNIVRESAAKWSETTEGHYASKIPYKNGFRRAKNSRDRNSSTFHHVSTRGSNNIMISIGHESYIARFLEVGVKPHDIQQGKRVLKHPGFTGTKTLRKTIDRHRSELITQIEDRLKTLLI